LTDKWFRDAASDREVARPLSTHKSGWRTAIFGVGIAATLTGIAVAVVATMDVLPSAASIPTEAARDSVASDRVARDSASPLPAPVRDIRVSRTVATGHRIKRPAFHAASLDRQRLSAAASELGHVHPRAGSRLMSSPAASAASEDAHRFQPSTVPADDMEAFHPRLFTSLTPSVDPERFAGARPVVASLAIGISYFFVPMRPRTEPEEPAETAPEAPGVALPDEHPAGRADDTAPEPPATTELAYAAPDAAEEDRPSAFDGFKKLFNRQLGLPGPGSGIAVYDIRNASVYMPNGRRLEAHSGLGKMKDNPRFAHVRMKGPTPPNIYNLRMREALFHGVEAIRMLPTDHEKMRGRNGILAHTAMLRGTNGSNGCLSFKHYDKFLTAFKRGEVKKIIVVPDMSHLPTYMASL
jgi:hypothetical protein